MLLIGLMASLFVVFKSCQTKKPDLTRFAKGSLKKLNVLETPPQRPSRVFSAQNGREMVLSEYDGQFVLLNIWATWCAPCVAEIPSLDALQAKYKNKNLQVVTISMDMAMEDAEAFFNAKGIKQLDVYHDPSLSVASDLGVSGLPISVIYNENGRELARISGEVDWMSPEVTRLLDYLLGDNPS